MKSDVFLAATQTDHSRAGLIARRLRAVKLKVRFDKKRAHHTPTAKDQRDVNEADQVLVLWSAAACDPEDQDCDWMFAIARSARARGVLVQATLDGTEPGAPFDEDAPLAFQGLTTRTLPDDFLGLVDRFAARQGRAHLSEWLTLSTRDRAGRAAWLAEHPEDPIAKAAHGKAKEKTGSAPTERSPPPAVSETPPVTPPEADEAEAGEPVAAPVPQPSVAPPIAQRPPNGRVASRPNVTLRPAPATPPLRERSTPLTLGTIGVAIAAFFVLAAVLGPETGPSPRPDRLPAVGNAAFPLPDRDGRDPARDVLEPGPILNDTAPPGATQTDDPPPADDRSPGQDEPAE